MLYWNEEATPFKTEIIAEEVDSVDFVYADFDINKTLIWENNWDKEVRRNIPLANQMTVNWKDGTKNSWLKRTAGSGRRENLGRRYNDRTQ